MHIKKEELFTIPNFLTILRILLVPVFIYCYRNMDHLYAACIVIVSGGTDFLDGYIARKTNAITELGKALDPFADKLLQFAIVLCLLNTLNYMIWIFLLFMIKELAMVICWIYMKKKGGYMNGAMWFGKVSTAIFYITTFLLIALPIQNTIYSYILMGITAFFLALSFILYIREYFSMFKTL